jgi:ABC-type lipoprotein export system ATPase subunit
MNLVIENVSKLYKGNVWGLRHFNLELRAGVLGLLGPNGAGKSTLMRILATITAATEGKVTWTGIDIAQSPNELRAALGYLPQDFGVYPNLNAVEFLEYLAAIKGLDSRLALKRIDELLQVLNLVDARKRPLGGYSGGMKQRFGIAQALLNDPQLLIVDEPTASARSRGAGALSQPALRSLRRAYSHSLHAHRFRRRSGGDGNRSHQQRTFSYARCAGEFIARRRRQSVGMGDPQRRIAGDQGTLSHQQHHPPR